MSLHKEIEFENEICAHLGASGWLYEDVAASAYDRRRALFPPDLVSWVQSSQPKAWEKLRKSHGAAAEEVLLDRVRKQLDAVGTLDVLRNGVEMTGLRQELSLAQFKPALAMNPDLQARYEANRLRVIRQVHYSNNGESSLDIVLFLNGIPVATAELKTDFTQSVDDAIDQYRKNRNPKPKKCGIEPLLSFPSGALVHFAVSESKVRMTTKLEGLCTRFLPFDMGNNGGAGNPSNEKGAATSYLWEQVWERESWLEILGRYITVERNSKRQIEKVIFPRYHQLGATRKLLRTIKSDGPGQKYLIQHSAGSGKTNSIAWTAHFLADLHDDKQQKMFDTVLVVSDRNVLDAQLQEAIFSFERNAGVVASIKGDHQSKSSELVDALAGGKKIVVCTIQTFPHALKAARELAATGGKSFAVIADEAHSSQTGDAAAKLKLVLTAEELQELSDGGEVSTEDILAAQMEDRASEDGITYVAFTATPKPKTIQIFGTRPDPTRPAGKDNIPKAFHVYSMRQAIEEGFILDVLQNYTSYNLAFKLAHKGKDWTDKEVDKSDATKDIMRWVRLHPHNIAKKVEVVVEHFMANVLPLLGGRAKAMVVTASRDEVVRWQRAITKYIKKQRYDIGALVAFSGKVPDPDIPGEDLSETSVSLNPGLKGRGIREAYATDAYQLLLVANKFQTGFDQPLLCGMYVDKRLDGIQAVQTLSRLNRCHPGKDTTYILDFVNKPQDILAAFKVYYETAELEGVTDPDLIFDIKSRLDTSGLYDDNEVERVVNAELNPRSTHSDLSAAIEPVASRILARHKAAMDAVKVAVANGNAKAEKAARETKEALELFKRNVGTYLRVYSFLSQIVDYGNTSVEKRYIFFKRLFPLLDFSRQRDKIDLTGVTLTHYAVKNKGRFTLPLGDGDPEKLKPMTDPGSGEVQEKQKALLGEIIAKLNDLFEGDLTENDQLVYVCDVIKGKLLESATLIEQAAINTKGQFSNSPDLTKERDNAIISAYEAHTAMSGQALGSERVRNGILEILLNYAGLYEGLRSRAVERGMTLSD